MMSALSKATASTAADIPVPEATAEIVPFRPPVRPAIERLAEMARHLAGVVLPPLIVISLTLFVWQLLCSEPGARLPPPTKVVSDAWDFIVDPFYDNGGIDKGAFWQISKSLGRVGIGFSSTSRSAPLWPPSSVKLPGITSVCLAMRSRRIASS